MWISHTGFGLHISRWLWEVGNWKCGLRISWKLEIWTEDFLEIGNAVQNFREI
jgi:hypothetical protein